MNKLENEILGQDNDINYQSCATIHQQNLKDLNIRSQLQNAILGRHSAITQCDNAMQ